MKTVRCALVLLCLTAIAASPAHAAVNATTEDGARVFLYEDGTWAYQQDSTTTSAISYTRAPGLENVVHSETTRYSLWYDAAKWSIKQERDQPLSEFEFVDASTLCQAMAIPYATPMTLDELEDLALGNVRSLDPLAEIIFKESRTVNNAPIRCIRIKATLGGVPLIFYYYLYSGDHTALQVVAYTEESVFEKFHDTLTDFLNGLVIH